MPTDTPNAIATELGDGLMLMLVSPIREATRGLAAADTP